MRHIANSSRGRNARTQQDLLHIAMNESSIKEEYLEHPICEIGFFKYTEEGLERMDDQTFIASLRTLFKSRPSSQLWDVVPDAPYVETPIFIEAPEAFRMSFEDKAQFLGEEFMRRPNMIGFKLELHNIERRTDNNKSGTPSVSITVYESSSSLDGSVVPVTIKTRYRANF
jgi:hypothetical protein